MNWKQASDKELLAIITSDPAARLSDVAQAHAEYERRNRKIPRTRTQFKQKKVYPR